MKLLLVVIAAFAAFAAARVAAERRKLRQSARSLGLDAPGVRVIDCENLAIRFAVKPEEGSVYVIHDINAPPRRIPLEDLAGCELLDYGERKLSLGRVLVGEAAADHLSGHAPLAVLRILRRDPEPDPIEYRLTRSAYYDDFRIFAREVADLVEEYTG